MEFWWWSRKIQIQTLKSHNNLKLIIPSDQPDLPVYQWHAARPGPAEKNAPYNEAHRVLQSGCPTWRQQHLPFSPHRGGWMFGQGLNTSIRKLPGEDSMGRWMVFFGCLGYVFSFNQKNRGYEELWENPWVLVLRTDFTHNLQYLEYICIACSCCTMRKCWRRRCFSLGATCHTYK